MRKTKNTLTFWAATIGLVLITAFCIGGTVRGRSNVKQDELTHFYFEKEKQLVKDTRAYMQEAGLRDSGVTLTRVVEESGKREYTLTVHHDKINRMSSTEKENLKAELSALVFPAENCYFYHEFLVTD